MVLAPDAKPPTPCFLLSSARAGSTLLARMLDSHSRISCPCEICVPHVVRNSWKLFKSLSNLRQICRYYRVAFPPMGAACLVRRTARAHFQRLSAAILEAERKQTLVVKDPRHAVHWRQAERMFSDEPPKYILLHRDARAVAHSFRHTLGRSLDRGYRVWCEAVRGMLDCKARHPQRCHEIRFEDFFSSIDATVSSVVGFLGHRYEPEMLHYGRFAHADDQMTLWRNQKLVSSVRKGTIQASSHPLWREDAELIDDFENRTEVKELNELLGYRPTSEVPSASECITRAA